MFQASGGQAASYPPIAASPIAASPTETSPTETSPIETSARDIGARNAAWLAGAWRGDGVPVAATRRVRKHSGRSSTREGWVPQRIVPAGHADVPIRGVGPGTRSNRQLSVSQETLSEQDALSAHGIRRRHVAFLPSGRGAALLADTVACPLAPELLGAHKAFTLPSLVEFSFMEFHRGDLRTPRLARQYKFVRAYPVFGCFTTFNCFMGRHGPKGRFPLYSIVDKLRRPALRRCPGAKARRSAGRANPLSSFPNRSLSPLHNPVNSHASYTSCNPGNSACAGNSRGARLTSTEPRPSHSAAMHE